MPASLMRKGRLRERRLGIGRFGPQKQIHRDVVAGPEEEELGRGLNVLRC